VSAESSGGVDRHPQDGAGRADANHRPRVEVWTRSWRPVAVGVLSFLWPGLGHAFIGRRRTAIAYAAPAGLIAAGLLVLAATSGLEKMSLALFSASTALTITIVIVLAGLWRGLAIVDSVTASAGRAVWRRPAVTGSVAALLVGVALPHAIGVQYAWSFYEADRVMFETATGPEPIASFPPSLGAESPAPDATPSPQATPETATSRINILLTGIDSSEHRDHALTDTLIVVSIDPSTHSVAMVSFPRDIADFRLSGGGRFHDRINALMTYALRHPERFRRGGLPTLTDELGYLLGIPIHYYASVDLAGFVDMVDAVGGVTVDNPQPIEDPFYGGWTDGRRIGFRLSKGRHTLDGQSALAYARSRKGVGDNDFTRARRQQQLLVVLARKLSDPAMLPRIPALLKAAARTIRTNFPPDRLSEMLDLSRGVEDKSIKRVVLGPPYARRGTDPTRYTLVLDEKKLADISIRLFGDDSRYFATAKSG
jgi:LCP family protein required for cell wall assembly